VEIADFTDGRVNLAEALLSVPAEVSAAEVQRRRHKRQLQVEATARWKAKNPQKVKQQGERYRARRKARE
jgi:hypothetical protein